MSGDHETLHLTPNPHFRPNLPFSYESVLCRLHAGYWMLQEASVTPREVIMLRLADAQ